MKQRKKTNITDTGTTDNNTAGGNTDKSQISLAMGGSEYKEFIKDRFENSPNKKDDEFHKNLEENNEQDIVNMNGENEQQDEMHETPRRTCRNRANKRAQFERVKSNAARLANLTDTTEDNKRVEEMSPKQKKIESLVYDDGVTIDDYEKCVYDYYL